MKLYLIRHTKVDCIKGTCYGQTDVGLATSFNKERAIVIDKIKGLSFDRIYSSPLKRCFLLAKHIAPQANQIVCDKRLMELNFGEWEMKMWSDIEKIKEAKAWFVDYINTKCPNGEAYTDLMERVALFIKDLKKEKQTAKIAIVAHGGVLIAFQSIIKKIDALPLFRSIPAYGEVIELTL